MRIHHLTVGISDDGACIVVRTVHPSLVKQAEIPLASLAASGTDEAASRVGKGILILLGLLNPDAFAPHHALHALTDPEMHAFTNAIEESFQRHMPPQGNEP